ncbi:erythromycin esterase family protein [Hymenobacter swuensis]|uniref:Erythromycin esterase n=1 Tax=Hymenobacter swuensis DY53 TaxID=1227739 RepID=W8F0K4_9BACT|nr:erythromycin esterase family protein [Hymenobacter swuensis]AHJ98413.1 hypothetical protein Hsw_2818 [Hymenobacter swuensis DY53]
MRLFYLITLLAFPALARAQARLNLNFEPAANRQQPLLLWHTRLAPDLLVRLDTLLPAAHGRGSLLLDASRAEEPVGGAVYTLITPIDSLRGQTVTISAQLRTSDFQGKAFLYAYAQSGTADGNLAGNDDFNTPPAPVTSNWQRVQIRLPVPAAATQLLVGLRLLGQGRVWLDDVRVESGSGQRLYADALLPGTEPLLLTAVARKANLDFERPLPPLPDPRYRATPDSVTPAQHGHRSLRLQAVAGTPTAYLGQVPLDSMMRGKTLVVQGYVRRSSATGPAPGFVATLLAEKTRGTTRQAARTLLPELPLNLPAAPGPDWLPFEVALPITHNVFFTHLTLGLRLPGPAPVWVDNLRLLVDGRPYVPPADPTSAALPTPAELAWLKKAARPLRTLLPDGGDFTDLAPFGSLVGTSQVIGLGEVGYGSRETAQIRHRLLRYLIETKGVRTLALETDLTACLALNNYLRTGQGNLPQLLQRLGSYNSAQTLALMQWLRTYNERADTKVQVWDVLSGQPAEAIAWLRERLPKRTGTLSSQLTLLEKQLRELPAAELRLNPFTQPGPPDARLLAVRATLRELRAALDENSRLSARSDLLLTEVALQRQLFQVLEQYVTLQTLDPELTPAYQAAAIAENTYWVHSQPEGGRLVILAHNNVLATTGGTGQRLRAAYGPGYLAVGQLLGAGSLRTNDAAAGPFRSAPVAAPEPGSYEYYFRAAGLKPALLPLRPVPLTPATQWLYQNLLLRDVGHTPLPNSFLRHDLRREFDAVLFLPVTTPLQPIP